MMYILMYLLSPSPSKILVNIKHSKNDHQCVILKSLFGVVNLVSNDNEEVMENVL